MEQKKDQQNIFTEEQISNFADLYDALKKVHVRLISEGYTIENDKIIPPKDK